MATSATIGTGCAFGVDSAGGTSITAVAECDSFSLSITRSEVEATNFDSAGVKQWIAGTKTTIVTVGGNFLPGSHNDAGILLYTNFQGGTATGWRLTFNDPSTAATITGVGYITALDVDMNGHDQVDTFGITIQDNGAAALTLAGFATA